MTQFAAIFQSLLAPVRIAVCHHCQRLLVSDKGGDQERQPALPAPGDAADSDTWIKWPGPETSLFSTLSPPELLDRHLTQGSELHAKELAHIPLTSKGNVSWTHFGGVPPADEINILRGQILLLQNQVMYERHKRTNHAMRNRRLLRRIAHVTALEEQAQSLVEQVEMREKDVQSLQVSLRLLQDHCHKLQQAQDSDGYGQLVEFRTTIQQNEKLLVGNEELKNVILTQQSENDDLKKELQEVRAQLFETKKENEILRSQNMAVNKWKGQVLHLQKEVLLMGEAQLRLQGRLQQQTNNHQPPSLLTQPLVQALKAEIKELKKQQTQNMLSLEAAQCHVIELDDALKTKDMAISEMKNNFENAKATHAAEIQAVEEKYRSMLHISQQLETQMLKLTAENDCLHQKMKSVQTRVSRPGRKTSLVRSDSQGTGSDDAKQQAFADERHDSGCGSIIHHQPPAPKSGSPAPAPANTDSLSGKEAAESSHTGSGVGVSGDSVSLASEGGTMASSDKLQYTDSEDAHSNFTTDSGIFSKEHA